jgi:uncharacterized protein
MAPGLLGIFLAVFAFDTFLPALQALGIREVPQSMTLQVFMGVPYSSLALILAIMFLFIVALADKFDPAKDRQERPPETESYSTKILRREWGWLPAGTLAGLLILLASWQGEYLGISGGFAALTAYISNLFGLTIESVGPLNEHTLWRAAMVVGLIPGAFLSAILAGAFKPIKVTPLWQEAFSSSIGGRLPLVFLGGFLIGLGAFIGGGCTTGAFLAGWPTLSVGSFYMGMTFFGTAMVTANLLYWRKWGLFSLVRAKGIDLATD